MDAWILYALISGFSFGLVNFAIKFIEINPVALSIIYYISATVFLAPFFKTPENKGHIIYAILLGLLIAFAGYFNNKMFQTTTHPGIASVIAVTVTTLLIYILSWIFLGLKVSLLNVVGTLLAIVGIYLVVI